MRGFFSFPCLMSWTISYSSLPPSSPKYTIAFVASSASASESTSPREGSGNLSPPIEIEMARCELRNIRPADGTELQLAGDHNPHPRRSGDYFFLAKMPD